MSRFAPKMTHSAAEIVNYPIIREATIAAIIADNLNLAPGS